jgi:hypothetical protein
MCMCNSCVPIFMSSSNLCVFPQGSRMFNAAANGLHGAAAQQQLPPPPPMGRGRGAVQPAWMADGASDPAAPGRPGGAVCSRHLPGRPVYRCIHVCLVAKVVCCADCWQACTAEAPSASICGVAGAEWGTVRSVDEALAILEKHGKKKKDKDKSKDKKHKKDKHAKKHKKEKHK